MDDNQYDTWSKLALDISKMGREIYNELRDADGVCNLSALCSKAQFPIYALFSREQPFLIDQCDIGLHGRKNTSIYVNQVRLKYLASTSYAHYNKLVVTLSGKRREDLPSIIYPHELLVRIAESLPEAFRGSYDWGQLGDVLRDRLSPNYNEERQFEFCQQLIWDTYPGSGLHFNLFHQENPGPLSLAYCEQDTWYVAIGAVGVSQLDFKKLLGSLENLQQTGGEQISRLQSDLRLAEQSKKQAP